MNNRELAETLITHLGGKQNILSFTNCITRLRVNVRDYSKVERTKIEQLNEVMGIVEDQTIQIVLGPGKVSKVAFEFGILQVWKAKILMRRNWI
ncbi:PTS glucose/sucrose transporter subunit IIB [Halobacillus salinarum]|uniref:PTS glucose/sucrose transporter subunit IIB n=1 Tax=Halobacillus salinarum TaxID=2932257 RepID=A0ABY4EHS1_9BACI|nr:PTS glucose/sucrose transporter subunit IIB [Halobacillus salinarum]